jgi:hypothetical protein
MIVDEGEPALFGIGRAHGAATAQVLRDRAGGNPDSQFQLQLVGDAFLSPRGILRRHLADQPLEVVGQAWSARRLRLPTPEEADPWRCQRRSVSAWTFTSASRQANH